MINWVLPNVISVDDVINVSDEILECITKISTGIVTEKINEFVNANLNSADNNIRLAAEKLQKAYSSLNFANDYLSSKEAKDFADELVSIQYSDISVNTDLDTLKKWRLSIIDLLAEDKEFIESYTNEVSKSETYGIKTAYTAKLDKDNLDSVLDYMVSLSKNNISMQITVVGLCERIRTYKNLFKNGNYNINKPTVLRKAIYKKDRLKNILKGLDFLIPKLENNKNAISWRKL